jgi:hypothetical protein
MARANCIAKLFLPICLPIWIQATGQSKLKLDSLTINHEPASFVFYTDIRNSFVWSDLKDLFIGATPVTIYGAAAGLEFNDRHQYTIGFYLLSKKAERRLANSSDAVNQRWGLTLINLGYTYTFLDKGKFELKLPFEVGFGKGKIRAFDNSGNKIFSEEGLIVPVQLGFITDFELTKWVGLRGSIGYRKTLKGSIFKKNFDSPYYSFGLSLYYENIRKSYLEFRKKKKEKRSQ